jgi:hypothetical protein
MSPGGLNSVAGALLGVPGEDVVPCPPEEAVSDPGVEAAASVGELAELLDPLQAASTTADPSTSEIHTRVLDSCRIFRR